MEVALGFSYGRVCSLEFSVWNRYANEGTKPRVTLYRFMVLGGSQPKCLVYPCRRRMSVL